MIDNALLCYPLPIGESPQRKKEEMLFFDWIEDYPHIVLPIVLSTITLIAIVGAVFGGNN